MAEAFYLERHRNPMPVIETAPEAGWLTYETWGPRTRGVAIDVPFTIDYEVAELKRLSLHPKPLPVITIQENQDGHAN